MIKILANDGLNSDGILLLEEANYQVDTEKIPQDKLASVLPEYDAIIVRSATKVRKELIDQCPNLKIIARGGVGMDNIDVEYARSKGIKVINTPKASSEAVAELVIGHIFNLARCLYLSNREMPTKGSTDFKNLKKSYSKGVQLRGKTLGIVGFGRIGQAVARIGLGLGMKVVPVDINTNELNINVGIFQNEETSISVKLQTVSLEEMLPVADFITLHIPFSGGKSILGEEQFNSMKDGVYLVNTSRGGAIGESDLLKALASGKVAGAALDVFANEPTPREDLLNHDRISVSPHIGAATIEAQRNIGLEIADAFIDFFGTEH